MTTRREWLQQTVALAIAAVPGLEGCATPEIANDKRWFNAVKSDGVNPRVISTPVSAKDIVNAVLDAEKRNGRVRMTGSGHSFSDVAMTTDHLMSPRGLTQCLPLDRSRLTP